LRSEYQRAENGNVAISGTLDLTAANGRALLAIGFGAQAEEAAFRALISIQRGAAPALEAFRSGWRQWQGKLVPLDQPRDAKGLNRYRVSTLVLASHRDVASGAIIASLSIPWGASKGDDDLGGYHLVWPRDLVEIAGGLLAAGAIDAAKGVLGYLMAVQEADGHWLQNSWLDGRPYWAGIQMDETGFPILLYDMLLRAGAIDASETLRYAKMIEAAAGYIVRNGPATQEDRWEEIGGYSPFTLAVEIAALLAAADAVEAAGKLTEAQYLREVADEWNEKIESWTYAVDTELSRRLGIEGYYVRIGSSTGGATNRLRTPIAIRNRADLNASMEADQLISPDALALVRFGLRASDDPRIRNTVTVIDAVLKRKLDGGPYWYRYNGDGYGEHEDGSPFDGTGTGRLWPLLTGERAHYELALGRTDEARRLLAALETSSSEGGLIPEQIWDSADIPERELFLGRPAGSAMPLAWAHAEHIKLLRSIRDEAVFDMPPQTAQRYLTNKQKVVLETWRMSARSERLQEGRILRVELMEPGNVRWSSDDWVTVYEVSVKATGFGTYICDLPTQALHAEEAVVFTIYWSDRRSWEGTNFFVRVESPAVE
jgi:glucoamylase